MNRYVLFIAAALSCALTAPAWASDIPESQCSALASLQLKDIQIVSATAEAPNVPITGASEASVGGVNSGPVVSGLPAFCRVVARAHPTLDSDIDFEVWMPQQDWDGRLIGAGNGGYAGSIAYYMLSGAIRAGQAAVSTDSGHHGESGDSSWAPGHPEKVRDFGWRAIHVSTVAAKELVTRYYGRHADHTYFNGYSNGGRQALVEASRFPGDYDGILAGAPALDWTQIRMTGEWLYRAQLPPQAWIRPEQAKLLQAEVLRQCDQLDGQFDGLVNDPRRCHIDTAKLACGVSSSADCFTPQQLAALALIYEGHRNRKGQWIALPLLAGGSEVHDPLFGWDNGVFDRRNFAGRNVAANLVQSDDALLQQPVAALDGHMIATIGDFDFDRDAARYKAADAFGGLDASPDLRKFFARGGKLILWQGWADANVPPQMVLDYRDAVLRIAGKRAAASMRLFMIPGMQHGVGGKGPDLFGQLFPAPRDATPDSNIAAALQAWIETGRVPENVTGKRHSASAPDDGAPSSQAPHERLICAYPMHAVLTPGADPDRGSSYQCKPEDSAGVTGAAGMLLNKKNGGAMQADSKNSGATPGWTDFLEGLRDLPARILARLPEDQRNDPQIQEEVGRLALSAVTSAAIDALASDPNHPTFVPQINNYITTGQPNADTNYRTAKIAPGGIYRLRGKRGSMNQAVIAEAGPRPKQVEGTVNLGNPRPVHDLNTLKVDAQGRYDVILSPNRPANYDGDWWQLDPTTNMLLVRMVGSNWGKEVEPTLSIERLDVSATRPRPPAATLEANLRGIPAAANFIAPLLVDHPQKLRAEGYVNKLKDVDFSQMGGLTGQFYYEGVYELTGDEALIIETKLPENCTYRSLILVNDIFETTDWYNNQSSLNGAQAPADSDGVLRIVVSARDPGVPNWLDTAGYASGVVQGRWVGCATKPVPTVRKVPIADVRKFLPAETPTITTAERDQQIRDRRATLQQRPLW